MREEADGGAVMDEEAMATDGGTANSPDAVDGD